MEHTNTEMSDTMKLKVDIGLPGDKLEELRQKSILCDIEIEAKDGRKINAHKLLLIAKSEFFCQLLLNTNFAESASQTVRLDEPVDIISELLRYIYTGEIQVTEQNAQNLLKAADQYRLPTLFKVLEAHIAANIDKDNCIALVSVAKLLNADVLYDKALEFIKGNFDIIVNFEGMSEEIILYFVKSKQVDSNKFLGIFCRWFSDHQDEKTASQVLECINFKQLNRNTIRQVQDIFGHLPACMKIICRKLVDELLPSTISSSPTPSPLNNWTLRMTRLCFKKLLDHKELKNNLIECNDGLVFRASLLASPFRIRFSQVASVKCKVVLRCIYRIQGTNDTYATYSVHDFNSGDCDLTLCRKTVSALWLAIYSVTSLPQAPFLQRSCQHLDTVKDISRVNRNVKVRRKDLEYDVVYDVEKESVTLNCIKGLKTSFCMVMGLGQNWVLHEWDFSSSQSTCFHFSIEEKNSVCLDLFQIEDKGTPNDG